MDVLAICSVYLAAFARLIAVAVEALGKRSGISIKPSSVFVCLRLMHVSFQGATWTDSIQTA